MRTLAWLVVGWLGWSGCGGDGATANGRVVVDTEGGITVVRDPARALELRLATSSAGLALRAADPSPALPGFVLLDDAAHGRGFALWITRLGRTRPANIQRWFDTKVAAVRRSGTVLRDDGGGALAGHPARVVDYVHRGDGGDTVQRFVGVDLEAQDLELVVVAIAHSRATAGGEERGEVVATAPATSAWLDAVVADVAHLEVH